MYIINIYIYIYINISAHQMFDSFAQFRKSCFHFQDRKRTFPNLRSSHDGTWDWHNMFTGQPCCRNRTSESGRRKRSCLDEAFMGFALFKIKTQQKKTPAACHKFEDPLIMAFHPFTCWQAYDSWVACSFLELQTPVRRRTRSGPSVGSVPSWLVPVWPRGSTGCCDDLSDLDG